jgi:monovalent cation/hydrogen antiporter
VRVFEIVVALLLGGAALSAIARRIGAPYPALVALGGAALALIPGVPVIMLDPELALALFVAPVLVDAAFDASVRDLRRNWRTVAGLALGAVVLTVALVAVVVRMLVPDLPWAAAIALGAIVAPPDAAAATAVLKQLRPPHRLMVILEGESLFNDASALLIYRLAVGATVAGAISGWSVIPALLLVSVASVALAFVLSRIMLAVTARIDDVASGVLVQFCATFAVWVLAERLHLSGIITLVVFAMFSSRKAAEVMPARVRIPAWAVWEFAVFVLNVLAFILVGFQLKSIVARIDGATGAFYVRVGVIITSVVIVSRLVWVIGAAAVSRWRSRARADRAHDVALSPRAAAAVGWCGMRGIVTLAAALALPSSSHGGFDFPYRDMMLVTAFAVVLGTLVLQGLTLRPLMQRLRLEHDDSVEREIRFARVETLQAAVAAAEHCPGAETAELVRHRYRVQLQHAEEDLANPSETSGSNVREADADVVRAATDAARQRLFRLRADDTIGDTAFQRVEEELDWAELDWARVVGERPAL